MSDCFICVQNNTLKLSGIATLKANAKLSNVLGSKLDIVGKINPNKIQQPALLKAKFASSSKINSKINLSQNIKALNSSEIVNIKAHLIVNCSTRSKLSSSVQIKNPHADKFAGYLNSINNIDNFASAQKLYPIRDITTNLNNSYFVNKNLSSGNLYQSIDEGIFTGNYNQHLKTSRRISDDNLSFIQPSSVFTSGTFRYKCEVSRPYHHPKNSFLFIRASAPLSNYGSDVAPEYRIHNIKLEDPSGNLIVKYKEINLRGDADYQSNNINYATYISEPLINNALLHTWNEDYPILTEASGYALTMDFDIICLDDPFAAGFDKGYEELVCAVDFLNTSNNDYLSIDGSPFSTQSQGYILNPTNSLRISALEICNSGDLCDTCNVSGTKLDSYFGFYAEVASIGQRISRNILPSQLLTYDYDINIYPESYSLWRSSPDAIANTADNTSVSGSQVLISKLRTDALSDYITLISSDPLNDSGRLTLKFSHQPPTYASTLSDGAFGFGDNNFDSAELQSISETDNYFKIDSIELKIVAKKAIGSNDYVLDVVGYSDDRILNITPKVGTFLQNAGSGIGSIPTVSGFKQVDDLGLSTESISDKSSYYENDLINADAGDHYVLSTSPIINSTTFQEYTIPLSIYLDEVDLGKPIDYTLSSYFENLYLDLYPIPSGASISTIQLVIYYKPSNALMLHTLGTPSTKELGYKDIKLLPLGRESSNDILINSDINDGPLSYISGIPHGYGEPSTLKTNYARRWRGVDGNIVNGPYDPNQFDFSFYNPEANHPFLNGLFDFTNISNNIVYTSQHPYNDYLAISGIKSSSQQAIRNLGLRFNSNQLFVNPTDYTTIDWTQPGHNLYGKISDSFDSALSITASDTISFTPMNYENGFSIYIRFTPGPNFYDRLFDFIITSYPTLMSLFFFNNKLVFAINTNTGIKEITDTSDVYEYQYPLSVLITYTANDNIIKLYATNEIDNSALLIGSTSGVVIDLESELRLTCIDANFFVHEFGISTSGNIVESGANRLLKQTTASNFLSGHSHTFDNSTWNKFKLHEYTNKDTSLWTLGDFKVCSFSPDFDSFTKRIGQDYIIHRLKHDGSAYSNITDILLPSSIYASELAYHTQIENDFLRFNLQDIPESNPEFYTAQPRICKILPRGYNFKDNSLVVESIIQHDTFNNIVWSDNNIGPKLIVSLYSKNQDPVDRPSKINWGLINRSIHYLKPSGCWQKLRSTFNYNDLIDTSEPWANFDLENIRSEFDHKYYSDDINDMFVQYDIVYPSGSAFDSSVKIHSITVKLEDSLTYFSNSSSGVNLFASGEKVSRSDINLYTYGLSPEFDSVNLYVSGQAWPNALNDLNLSLFGVDGIEYSDLRLFTKNSGITTNSMPIFVSGGNPRSDNNIILVMTDNTLNQTNITTMPLFIKNKAFVISENILPLVQPENYSISSPYVFNDVNLVTFNDQKILYNTNNSFDLYINSDPDYYSLSGSMNLFTINYLAFNQNINQQATISWNENNVGESISSSDNEKAFLEANDEIRGVDLLCYGNCENDQACQEEPIYLHDTFWYNENSCIQGGILRVKNTYTNLDVSGFKTPVGYSGNFYGIRKYDGLIPNAPYDITITAKTGDNQSVPLPREFIELDYGSNNYVNYSGVKFTDETERQSGNRYGKSVAVKYDLMTIGAPNQTVSYSEYDSSGNLSTTNLQEAGSVFVYRRESRPSGSTWNEDKHKSPWLLETKLTLPSGLLKDYPTNINRNSINGITLPYPITERFWNVGQEGRQFGHSVDIAINNTLSSFQEDKKEIIVVGGPSAKWSRDFEDLSTSGVSIGLIIFTDEFVPSLPDPSNPRKNITYTKIIETIQNKDLIFQYFSDPPIRFDVKLLICEPFASGAVADTLDFPEPKPSFITKKRIPRNEGIVTEENTLVVFSGIKSAFEEAFPYDNTKIHNNIPPILGIYVDNSRSLGRSAVVPALDKFIEYYKDYSFASGLVDFYGVRSSGATYEYIPPSVGSEDWISMSNQILNNLLDTGRLVSDNQVRFITSGVGPESLNVNLTQFNHPPSSGGRVYIFEKESGAWNLIQEIQSPEISYSNYDRFGHAVSISEDTNIIAIGSPYINDACKVYQYQDSEKQRLFNSLYSWLTYANSITGGLDQRYVSLIDQYAEWLETYGFNYSNQILYSKLTSTEKFQARDYLDIEEYENIFTYSYSNIPYVGNWEFIPQLFAPTSRLGYSVALNDDGSTVAIGAPTDSFNAFDDYGVYYKNDGYLDPLNIDNINGFIKPSWRSNVNAGAVRLLESRDYYPHNKVVEFGKFGNLQESLNDPLDSGHFNYLATIFQDKDFDKTPFDQVSIPSDAGLAFIITPEVDAVSDEIINNIISWLALGDRNLVLVGNDPVWEGSGVYETSNFIINKILNRLNSKMRLHPAKNQYQSLPSGNSLVVPSYIPRNATQSYIDPFELDTGYGVADIRMHLPGYQKFMPCIENGVNNKCALPLTDKGDLRAEWIDACSTEACGARTIEYAVNWPFIFKTYTPNCCEVELEAINEDRFDLSSLEPVPLLAAGEVGVRSRIIPAVPETYVDVPILEDRIFYNATTAYIFDQDNIQPNSSFVYSASTSGYSSYESNIDGVADAFYRPQIFEDRQSLLQAKSFSITDTLIGQQLVSQVGRFCVEQVIGSSTIVAIANTRSESKDFLLSGVGDNAINFYANMVAKDANGSSTIAQLGGWTGRASFVDAYSESILSDIFRNCGNNVKLNVLNLSASDDVCWIANPTNLPSEQDIIDILSWLNRGNKKLIITHDSTTTQILKVDYILQALGSNIKSLYLPVKDQYASSLGLGFINSNHPIYQGFGIFPISEFFIRDEFVPFQSGPSIVDICSVSRIIYDDKIISDGYWKIDSGLDHVVFPAVAGSGYKLFIDVVSENQYENQPLSIYVKNATEQPKYPFPDVSLLRSQRIKDISISDIGPIKILETNIQNTVRTISFDVQVKEGATTLELYINSLIPRINQLDYIPKTIRLLSVSGVAMPVKEVTIQSNRPYKEIVGYTRQKLNDAQPEIIISEPIISQISSLNDGYCYDQDCIDLGFGNQYVADGPIVVAQEVESVSSFNVGVARSRITVISDSSLVQGRFMSDEFGRMSANTVAFLSSLYPETSFPTNVAGKQYINLTKIVAPERGSPQKYLSLIPNAGLKYRFDNGGGVANASSFDDKESMYDPRYVVRSELPWSEDTPEQLKELLRNLEIEEFKSDLLSYGAHTKFSGIINSKTYIDAGINGGIPEIMKDTGSDYLDFDVFTSGFPGDLFGFSVSLHKNKLVIGAPFMPFSDEEIHDWQYYLETGGQSGVELSYNGGAGSVYVYEKTFNGSGIRNTKTTWEFTQKIRPSSINIGHDLSNSGESQSYLSLGPNNYNNSYLEQFSIITDQFGYDVSIDSDIIIVGAPGHDFDKYANNIYASGSYIRKAFNEEFDIPSRFIQDLGNSGVRNIISSGITVLNNGAIFAFENRVIDWPTRTTKWTFVEKILQQGLKSREQRSISASGTENENFGRSVYVHRSNRSDSDYVIVGGSDKHIYSISGNSPLANAGAAYSNDIMLRDTYPAIANTGTYIDAKVFGERDSGKNPTVRIIVNNTVNNQLLYASGIIYSDENGAIFLEASGQDPAIRGFIQHRPFIVSVDGLYKYGSPNSGNMPLFIDSTAVKTDNMNLFVVSTTGNVYNNIGLYNSAITDFGSGIINFYTDCPDPTQIVESGLLLYMPSGVGLSTDTLNMRVRGK